jgi:hypothetical protein
MLETIYCSLPQRRICYLKSYGPQFTEQKKLFEYATKTPQPKNNNETIQYPGNCNREPAETITKTHKDAISNIIQP